MKRFLLFTLLIYFASTILCNAQQVLQKNDYCNLLGKSIVYRYQYLDNKQVINPKTYELINPQSGANVTWDISNATKTTTSKLTLEYLPPAKTPHGDKITNSNFCKFVDNNKSYQYSNCSNESVSLVGIVQTLNPNDPYIRSYSKPRIDMTFPFTYKQKISNVYTYTYNNKGPKVGTMKVEYIGWGKLITPDFTYDNLALVKTVDSLHVDQGEVNKYLTYTWYHPEKGIVAKIDHAYTLVPKAPNTSEISYLLSTTVSAEELKHSGINSQNAVIMPNPSNNQSTLKLSGLDIEKDVNVQVVNILGQVIQDFKVAVSADNTFIPLNVKEKGVYMVRVLSDNKISRLKWIVD